MKNHAATTVTIAVALAVVTGVAGGYAYWTVLGGGLAGTSASNSSSVTLSRGTPVGTLHPGGTTSVAVLITNPNTSDVRVNKLVIDTSLGDVNSGFTADDSHSGCTGVAAGLAFSDYSPTGGMTVPALGTLRPSIPATALKMALDAPSVCQGATFTVFLKVANG